MKNDIKTLFRNNRDWVASVRSADPEFFRKLVRQQAPRYLWIGCADSRVPANEIVGLLPGELFVHRNVGNVVVHTDLNCLSVIQYAVDILKVEHVIVCGHYDCGGVKSAMERKPHGLIDNWLRHIQDVEEKFAGDLSGLGRKAAEDRLCELNTAEQVRNVCRTTMLERAWDEGRRVAVHGFIYGIDDGKLKDLGLTCSSRAQARALEGRRPPRLS
ncbi:MAG TPA: carbonate dehydratase [Elusimicrobia bacterium]|jgi:carbonic anhydrase|nr:carbonate dehydratase [Elusimicrobiota bacterium]